MDYSWPKIVRIIRRSGLPSDYCSFIYADASGAFQSSCRIDWSLSHTIMGGYTSVRCCEYRAGVCMVLLRQPAGALALIRDVPSLLMFYFRLRCTRCFRTLHGCRGVCMGPWTLSFLNCDPFEVEPKVCSDFFRSGRLPPRDVFLPC